MSSQHERFPLLDGEHFFIGAETKLHKVAPSDWKQRSKKGHRQLATFVTYFRVKFYVGDISLMRCVLLLLFYYQGDHPPGKPGKVRELESGQGKVRETGKSQGKVRESYNHHLAGARVAKILPHFKDISRHSSMMGCRQPYGK